MRTPFSFFVVLVLALFVALASSQCIVSNCKCKGGIGPGMNCADCTGSDCYCSCPSTVDSLPQNVLVSNSTFNSIQGALSTSCIANNCNCKNWGDCSTCSGRNCQCSCSAAERFIQTTTGGCLMNSQCQGASCSSTVGSMTYCCPAGSQSCSISVVNGVAQCSCY